MNLPLAAIVLLFGVSQAAVAPPGPGTCWYPYICSEASAYKTVEDAESAEDCYNKCQNDAGECNHWTFHKLHGRTTCSFLLDCDQKDENCPNYPEDDTYCGSGPPNCDEKKYPCDPLKYATDNSRLQVRWQCSEESYPYQNPIPIGSICYAECTTWLVNGESSGELVTVEARCMGKDSDQQGAISKWEFVGGDTVTIPDDEGNPGLEVELPTGSDPQCRCNPINIPDGFLEPGAHVMCEKRGVREEMTITSDDHCVLFCDGHVVLEVQCLAGVWTDAVEDYCDFWCWMQPEDDCGTTTPTATPTENPTTPTPTEEPTTPTPTEKPTTHPPSSPPTSPTTAETP